MTRAFLILALLALAGTAQAAEVSLRDAPSAHGARITLGDLFEGAGAGGSVFVAAAPANGGQAVLDAAAVQMAAKRAGLDWANAEGRRRIIVASAVEATAPRTASRAAGRRIQALAYARNINAGEIVQPADLVWSDDAVAPSDAPSDADQAIGKAARRPLRSGAAVAARDLMAARVIRRGEVVEVVFEDGGVSLVLQAKALADASVGDVVQLQNPVSKKVVEAVASGPGRALVGPRADALKSQSFALAAR